jgi:hypothetical protein
VQFHTGFQLVGEQGSDDASSASDETVAVVGCYGLQSSRGSTVQIDLAGSELISNEYASQTSS